MIACINPKIQNISLKDELMDAFAKVVDSGQYILGPEVENFEKNFARYIGVDYCIGVASGTDAILLAIKALGIGHGDEVITVSHTAVATISAIVLSGATPVFVDIEESFFTISPMGIKNAITPKTKAILCVHLYGQMCDMDAILDIAYKNKLHVIEDCAQATGSEYGNKKSGSIGDIGCFSFFPTKNLGAIGDGGAVTTNSENIARNIIKLRQYGWDKNRISLENGYNSRLDELQAAFLSIKLKFLSASVDERVAISKTYASKLNELMLPKIRAGTKHSFHLYVARTQKRDELIDWLKEQDIMAMVHYARPAHLHPAFQQYKTFDLPVTEKVVNEIISLPIYSGLGKKDIDIVCDVVSRFYE